MNQNSETLVINPKFPIEEFNLELFQGSNSMLYIFTIILIKAATLFQNIYP